MDINSEKLICTKFNAGANYQFSNSRPQLWYNLFPVASITLHSGYFNNKLKEGARCFSLMILKIRLILVKIVR